MKRFAAFDIDGTLVRWQLFHTIVDKLAANGSMSLREHDTMKDLFTKWKRRDDSNAFHTYETAMLQTWFELMEHTTHQDFLVAVDAVFNEQKDFVYHYTRELSRKLKKQGYVLIAISGSHQEVVDKIAQYYNFDHAIGSIYPTADKGKFTGEEITPVIDKGRVLQEVVAIHNLSWDDSYAVGDSRSDAKMMELVTHPIAFNPNQKLLTIAQKNSWNIVVERKNVIYELNAKNNTYVLQ